MTEAATEQHRSLYKSRRNRIVDGVCGGIAEYFDVDPTLVRLLWVMVTLLGGSGFILYIVAMIVMPVNPEQVAQPSVANHSDRKRFFGILLILVGAFVLIANFGWVSAGWGFWSLSRKVMIPMLIILLGAFFIYLQTTKRATPTVVSPEAANAGDTPASAPQPPEPRELRRSATDKKLFGVCSGLGKYFNVDPTIVRFLFVFLVLASFGWAVLLYIILGLAMPEEKPVPITR